MSIKIFYDKKGFRVRDSKKLKKIVTEIIREKGFSTGDINIIISSDNEIRAINKEFLKHDYYTDVITFPYYNGHTVNGEIYISGDTVKINSRDYKAGFQNEMKRVIIHGSLHLTGLNDSTDDERAFMKGEEDRWLSKLGEYGDEI